MVCKWKDAMVVTDGVFMQHLGLVYIILMGVSEERNLDKLN